MINITDLGLMTFSRASEQWGKERTYVLQQHRKHPQKFLPGSVAYLNGGKTKGTWVITREGMEHLTGQTAAEAANELWQVVSLKDFNKVQEHFTTTEKEAIEKLLQLIDAYTVDTKTLPFKERKLDFIDPQKKNYGIKLPGGMIFYYTNVRKGNLPDIFHQGGFTAERRGSYFLVKDKKEFEIAQIYLSGEIELFYSDTPSNVKNDLEIISTKIKRYAED
ncbi:helix-turn-helix domain-containing protein [Enterococcus rivorum]|uniref:Helix-turn-helix domain-containing protein n=1 Tax=Enterococcus rivorum TaxID=762845 RepID=A0A1E5L0G5_9ENTE|nr:helix-turn-helix domain-containing protein [Enterococcus rivorum]MBP2098870.1 hypothetical protein [Enterococcus rivorum]OEH83597.1 hypothetical protein BCR26_08960 [Enterococcus rivorum]